MVGQWILNKDHAEQIVSESIVIPNPSTISKLLPQSYFLGQTIHPLHQVGLCKLPIPYLQSCAFQSQPENKKGQ